MTDDKTAPTTIGASSYILVNTECRMCGKTHSFRMVQKDLEDYQSGKIYAQDIKYLSADERELLISRICGECYERIFADDED